MRQPSPMNRTGFLFVGLLTGVVALGVLYLLLAPSPAERLNQAVQEKRWEEAEALAQAQLETAAPEDTADLYATLALAHRRQGEHAEALAAYQAAFEARPEDPELRRRAAIEMVELGHLKAEAGDNPGALADYREAAALAPLIPYGHRALTAHLREQFRLNEALAALEIAMQHIPQDVGLRLQLAWLLASHPDPSKQDAERSLRLANETLLHDRTPETLDTFAVALAALGEYKDALRFELDAIDLAGGEGAPLFEERRRRVGLFLKERPYIEQPAQKETSPQEADVSGRAE
ncbi:MAG: tetratricopeptide repeat protein [Myxococcota bacterium]|nr:tetratricopeptide repeat protein [Myxococcota bacterium]